MGAFKTRPRYCGQFKVLTRIGLVAYKLRLPGGTKIYYVSLLKKTVEDYKVEESFLQN